jgi:hypothetical protein
LVMAEVTSGVNDGQLIARPPLGIMIWINCNALAHAQIRADVTKLRPLAAYINTLAK